MSTHSDLHVHATRRDISRTVSATKNLRAISMALVQKVRSSASGISSTEIANQLAKDAVRQVLGAVSMVSDDDLVAVEKNIRRRLYDSLKVLVSIGAIRRTRKDKILYWQGVAHLIPPRFSPRSPIPLSPDRELLKRSLRALRSRMRAKKSSLSQLVQQVKALEMLHHRNRSQHAVDPQSKIHMPFVLVRTPPATEIKLETTKDTRSMSFRFSDCFEVVNDSGILDRIFFVDDKARRPSAVMIAQSLHVGHPRRAVTKKRQMLSPRNRAKPNLKVRNHNSAGSQAASDVDRISPVLRADTEHRKPDNESSLSRSPKRRRVPGVSPFVKYTSGNKPPLSPAASLVRRLGAKKPKSRIVHMKSPLQESLRALASSPGTLARSPSDLNPTKGNQDRRCLETEGTETQDASASLKGTSGAETQCQKDNELGHSPGLANEARPVGGHFSKRLYAPLRSPLHRASSPLSNRKLKTEASDVSEEFIGKDDEMLSPGLSPLPEFGDDSLGVSSSAGNPVVRRLFGSD